MSHCGATVPSCPNRCACGLEVKAELKAEHALTDEQNHDGTHAHETPQSPLGVDCEPAGTISGPITGIRGLVTRLSFTGRNP